MADFPGKKLYFHALNPAYSVQVEERQRHFLLKSYKDGGELNPNSGIMFSFGDSTVGQSGLGTSKKEVLEVIRSQLSKLNYFPLGMAAES